MARARVVLLAGPSGSGKSYIAHRTGLPVLCLDDFYRDIDDPALPRAGEIVDWESPLAWNHTAAIAAIEALCLDGSADTPIYAFGRDRSVGRRLFTLDGAGMFVAEGIFAAEIVAQVRARGLLAAAYALRRPRAVTYARRLARDLAERRKPPGVLIRRGLRLMLSEPAVLARQQLLGARPTTARDILAQVRRLTLGAQIAGAPGPGHPDGLITPR
jgi:uridine kinase